MLSGWWKIVHHWLLSLNRSKYVLVQDDRAQGRCRYLIDSKVKYWQRSAEE